MNVVSIDEIKDVVKSFKEEKENTIVEKIGDMEQSRAYSQKDLKKSTIVFVYWILCRKRSILQSSRMSFRAPSSA